MNASYYQYWGKTDRTYPAEPKWHLLPYHCLDVAAVGEVLLRKNELMRKRFDEIARMDQETCSYWLLLFLGLHDVGKFSVSFQGLREDLLKNLQQKEPAKPYNVRHDRLGHLLMKESLWQEVVPPDMREDGDYWRETIRILSHAFAGHHGSPPNMTGGNNLGLRLKDFFDESDLQAAEGFARDLKVLFLQQHQLTTQRVSPENLYQSAPRISWALSGFVVLCDWIGSNSMWFPYRSDPMPLNVYRTEHAMPHAERAVREAGVGRSWTIKDNVSFRKLFNSIKVPTPLQEYVEKVPVVSSPQLFILEDITGSGKTEAALFLARRLMASRAGNGVFVALPTMATSNAMFDRLAKVYRNLFNTTDTEPSIVLAHGARHLSETFMKAVANASRGKDEYDSNEETASAQCASWLADNRKKAFLADVGVGTLDQALLAILPSRFQSLRLWGVIGHILIVDEVHAYNAYMNKLLQNLLTFHASMGGSAILLSATLPRHVRQAMVDSFAEGLGIDPPKVKNDAYPLATNVNGEQGISETAIEAAPQRRRATEVKVISDRNTIERLLVEASRQGKCACWIRNTVHDALESCESLRKILPPDKTTLFHARFAMGDRLDIEKFVRDSFGKESAENDRHGKVLVATQVVEQSLDLDFDVLVSDLAPMDLLIQRAGRLHRHIRDEKGNPLSAAETDRREPSALIVHSPEPVKDADGDWFKRAFPKAAYVYPSHGCLWLTAHLLSKRGMLKVPNDARELIEAAFGEEADKLIPAPLRQRDLDADGEIMRDRSAAHINMLKLEEGYVATPNQWLEDMKTPTRLGEMETTLRLARWDGNTLTPWCAGSDFPWDMSQVNVLGTKVNAEANIDDPNLRKATEELKSRLPDKGKWTVLVPLILQNDLWCGEALDKNGKKVSVAYHNERGVSVSRKE